jgi:hypothetical protein
MVTFINNSPNFYFSKKIVIRKLSKPTHIETAKISVIYYSYSLIAKILYKKPIMKSELKHQPYQTTEVSRSSGEPYTHKGL